MIPLLLAACAPLALLPPAQDPPAGDPTKKEVPLPCAPGWDARLVLENGDVGVWTVRSFQVFEQYAAPEIVALDDEGRCQVVVSYSGKWTPLPRVHDGAWLGGLTHGDVDPRIEGSELYTGGQKGNLYQLVPHHHGALDARLIAHFPGLELHTLLSGDLDPRHPGPELLVFTRPGRLFRVSPTGPDGKFEVTDLGKLPGRVRDAVVLPDDGRIVTASRDGALRRLVFTGEGPRWEVLHTETMGFGRLTHARGRSGEHVLYATLDDGRVLRLAETDGGWETETVYAGPQGPRGVAAGRFFADPEVEAFVVFGYSGKVQLVSRRPGLQWRAETIFEDRDKGHWLTVAEADGRNATQEIFGSGYGGRVFQLGRPPGYGLSGTTTAPVEPPALEERENAREGPPRVAVRASRLGLDSLSPLSYRGGFQAKTMVYETLVQRDAQGRIVPGLATSWSVSDDGRTFRFQLREGARFHDGQPVDAESVRVHFRRWVGLPEHGWLGASRHIRDVVAESERELRVVLDRPYALLPDLCVINPCAVLGPAAHDREGEFVRPVGSGPFELVGPAEGGALRFRRVGAETDGERCVDLVAFDSASPQEPIEALLAGDVDLVTDGWYENVPRELLAGLRERADLEVFDGPGSSVWYLSFSLKGASASRDVRRAVAGAVDRTELVDRVERGMADEAFGWAAPTVRTWPRGTAAQAAPRPSLRAPLVLLVAEDEPREVALARVLAEQLAGAGLPTDVLRADAEEHGRRVRAGDFDLRIEHTWGVPYDPFVSMCTRFLPRPSERTAASMRYYGVDPRLTELVARAAAEPHEKERLKLCAEVQAQIDDERWIVPLIVPRRVGVARRPEACAVPLDHDLYRLRLAGLLQRD